MPKTNRIFLKSRPHPPHMGIQISVNKTTHLWHRPWLHRLIRSRCAPTLRLNPRRSFPPWLYWLLHPQKQQYLWLRHFLENKLIYLSWKSAWTFQSRRLIIFYFLQTAKNKFLNLIYFWTNTFKSETKVYKNKSWLMPKNSGIFLTRIILRITSCFCRGFQWGTVKWANC